ncbi:MAG: ComEC family competence protein [Defluviitaleaceae bacterium]|nr:ComEC family competence protein [Defluviitaleaceae bacterium]
MKRPLCIAFGCLILGIVMGRVEALSALDPILLVSLGLGLGLLFCLFLYRVYRYGAVFVLVLFILVGLWRVQDSMHSHVTAPVYVEFRGVVIDTGRTGGGNQRAAVIGSVYRVDNAGTMASADDGHNIGIAAPAGSLEFTYVNMSNFRVMAYIRPHQPQAVIGREIVITGYLQPLARAHNPAGYDQFQHLRSQKIDSVMWPDEIALGDLRPSLIVTLRQFRDRLANVYESLLPVREAGVMRSMVLGDRLDMDQNLAAQYRMMGIFHILSISGMHVGILTLAAFTVLKLVMAERNAGIVVLVIMVAYCLMTGAAVPTVRAVTMGGVLVFGRVLYRDYDLLASVSFAGIVLLIYEPLFLFNLGFQLSFGAVFGIGILKAPIERGLALLRLPGGNFRGSLSVGIAAVMASYVAFQHHLYEIPLYSVIGNLVIMPTVTILLVIGALVGLVGLFWMPGAMILAGPVYYILRFYELASSFFAALPGAMALTGGGSLAVTGAAAGMLLSFAFAFSGYGEDFKKRLVLLFGAVLVLIGCVFMRDFHFDLRVTVLHTHGGYAVMRHRGDMLVMGSGRGGEAALISYMDMRGVRQAHGLVLTEAPRPADIRRIEELLPRIRVLYLPGGFYPPDELRMAAMAMGVEITWLNEGYILEMGRLRLQAKTQPGFRLGFGYGIIDFMHIDDSVDMQAGVIIGSGAVAIGGRVYPTEYYGAVQLRIDRRRVRYWLL